jgi:hypothetical protein
MKATIAFVVLFLLIGEKSRTLLTLWATDAQKWIVAWAPFSFIILALAIAAPIAALMLMVKWPKVQEPENPLAKYKNDEVLE